MKNIVRTLSLVLLSFVLITPFLQSQQSLPEACKQYYYTSFYDGFYTIESTPVHLKELGYSNGLVFSDFQMIMEQKNKVTVIDLSDKVHENYYQGISACKNAEYINLSEMKNASWGNLVSELPWELFYMRNLKVLIANKNNLSAIPTEICNLNQLDVLSFSGNVINEIPKELTMLSNLKILDLSNNNIKAIPNCINKLKNTEVLLLNGNKISETLPDELAFMPNLKVLTIQFDENMPEESLMKSLEIIAGIETLQVLHIRNSGIEELPESICMLTDLQQLSLRGNPSLDLKDSFTLFSNMSSLHLLDISFCGLKKIPKEIGLMAQLEELYAGNNKMLNEHYNMDYANQITSLPSSIDNCTSLSSIYLWNKNINHDKVERKLNGMLADCQIEVRPQNEHHIAANR